MNEAKEAKRDFLTRRQIDEIAEEIDWHPKVHEGCRFIGDVVTGKDVQKSLRRMMKEFRKRPPDER